MRHIFFFATPADIRPVLERFEAPERLKFVETGKRTTAERPIYLASSTIPDAGLATAAASGFCTTYMVSHRETKNIMYTFRDETGDQRWLSSNGDNEDTVLLTLAGIWKTGTLLPGHMNTLHDTSAAPATDASVSNGTSARNLHENRDVVAGPRGAGYAKDGKAFGDDCGAIAARV